MGLRIVGRDGHVREAVRPAVCAPYIRRAGENKAQRRRRLGLLRPIRCPFCRAYTPQERTGDSLPGNTMLSRLARSLFVLRRRCLLCRKTFRDVRSGPPSTHEGGRVWAGGR